MLLKCRPGPVPLMLENDPPSSPSLASAGFDLRRSFRIPSPVAGDCWKDQMPGRHCHRRPLPSRTYSPIKRFLTSFLRDCHPLVTCQSSNDLLPQSREHPAWAQIQDLPLSRWLCLLLTLDMLPRTRRWNSLQGCGSRDPMLQPLFWPWPLPHGEWAQPRNLAAGGYRACRLDLRGLVAPAPVLSTHQATHLFSPSPVLLP